MSRTSGPGAPVAMARFQPRAAAEPVCDLLLVGGGVAVAVPGGGDLLAGQAGEHRPAVAGVGEGLAQGGVGHDVLQGWPGAGTRRMAAGGGLGHQLGGEGGQDAGLVFGLGGQQLGGALGLEVEDGPQAGQDVQAVQAQVVGGPAGGDGGGQVAVAGAVDLLDPGVQAGDGFVAFGGGELPPCRGRVGVVAVGVGGELGGQVGDLPVQGLEPGQDGGVVFEACGRCR